MGLIGCVVLQGRAVQADALKVWIGSKCGLAQGVDWLRVWIVAFKRTNVVT